MSPLTAPPHPNKLDPLIEPVVRELQTRGIETFESCQGTKGHCFEWPTVRFNGGAGTGYVVVGIALELGWPIQHLQRDWSVRECAIIEGGTWAVEFAPFRLPHLWANTAVQPLLESALSSALPAGAGTPVSVFDVVAFGAVRAHMVDVLLC